MFFGYFPFDGENYETLRDNIISEKPNYPKNIKQKEKDFFDKIFVKDKDLRITLKEMLKHDFLVL